MVFKSPAQLPILWSNLMAQQSQSLRSGGNYAGMPGHCRALVDQEPRRGKEASSWVLETTMGQWHQNNS